MHAEIRSRCRAGNPCTPARLAQPTAAWLCPCSRCRTKPRRCQTFLLGHPQRKGGNSVGSTCSMSTFTFDEAGSVAQLPKELGENVTSMLGESAVLQPSCGSNVCTPHMFHAGGAERAFHLISCWKRKVGGDPQLAGLAQSIAADPELHRKRQVRNKLNWVARDY